MENMEQRGSTTISLVVPEWVHTDLSKIAKKRGLSRSFVARKFLIDGITNLMTKLNGIDNDKSDELER